MVTANTPTFSIYDPGTQKVVDTLQHSFIERMRIARHDLPAMICAKDGLVYQSVYDCRIPEGEEFEAIISFQQHTYGRFAIVRVAR